jgi:hypothetical protein
MKNIALAVLILVTGCCSNSHKANGTSGAVVAWDKVQVYYSMPDNAKVIGTIYANSFNGTTGNTFGGAPPNQNTGNALDTLKQQAANLGANGIVINPSDEKGVNNTDLAGKAVFVSP